jgi:hypothetical protein
MVIDMNALTKTKIDLNKIIKNNPNVDSTKLAQTLQALGELKKQGINVGPNYNLGSPFSRPDPNSKEPQKGSILQAK